MPQTNMKKQEEKRFICKVDGLEVDIENLSKDLQVISGVHDFERDGEPHKRFRDVVFRTDVTMKKFVKILSGLIRMDINDSEREGNTIWAVGALLKKKGTFASRKILNVPNGSNGKPITTAANAKRELMIQAVLDVTGIKMTEKQFIDAVDTISKVAEIGDLKMDDIFFSKDTFAKTNALAKQYGVSDDEAFNIEGKVYEV